jgi:hypothetical protein
MREPGCCIELCAHARVLPASSRKMLTSKGKKFKTDSVFRDCKEAGSTTSLLARLNCLEALTCRKSSSVFNPLKSTRPRAKKGFLQGFYRQGTFLSSCALTIGLPVPVKELSPDFVVLRSPQRNLLLLS